MFGTIQNLLQKGQLFFSSEMGIAEYQIRHFQDTMSKKTSDSLSKSFFLRKKCLNNFNVMKTRNLLLSFSFAEFLIFLGGKNLNKFLKIFFSLKISQLSNKLFWKKIQRDFSLRSLKQKKIQQNFLNSFSLYFEKINFYLPIFIYLQNFRINLLYNFKLKLNENFEFFLDPLYPILNPALRISPILSSL